MTMGSVLKDSKFGSKKVVKVTKEEDGSKVDFKGFQNTSKVASMSIQKASKFDKKNGHSKSLQRILKWVPELIHFLKYFEIGELFQKLRCVPKDSKFDSKNVILVTTEEDGFKLGFKGFQNRFKCSFKFPKVFHCCFQIQYPKFYAGPNKGRWLQRISKWVLEWIYL